MLDKHSISIRKLVRWRSFQESQTKRNYLQATANMLQKQDDVDEAMSVLNTIHKQRVLLLMTSAVDLGVLQAIGGIEQIAWNEFEARREDLKKATSERSVALKEHLEARSRQHVAENRYERVIAYEIDLEEKRVFDRMAALFRPRFEEAMHD